MEETKFFYEYRNLITRNVSICKVVSWHDSIKLNRNFHSLGSFSLKEVKLLRDLLNKILEDNGISDKSKEE